MKLVYPTGRGSADIESKIRTPVRKTSATWELQEPRIAPRARRADSASASSSEPRSRRNAMTTVLERCAGLDVHQAVVMATVRIPDGSGGRAVITETFA